MSLTPSETEIVAAVGGVDLLVGVDRFSAYPPGVEALPKVGDFLDPSLEAILRLQPDLVLLDAVQTSVDEKLRGAGLRTLPLPMQSVADVRAAISAVGDAIDRHAQAAAVLATLDGELAAVRDQVARAGAVRPRVLVIVDRMPNGLGNVVAAGPGSYLDELVTFAGGENVMARSPVRYAQISPEEILSGAPEVIFDAVHTDDTARARRDWDILPEVPAVRSGRVHVLADPLFVSPGPRMGQALQRIAAAVQEAREAPSGDDGR